MNAQPEEGIDMPKRKLALAEAEERASGKKLDWQDVARRAELIGGDVVIVDAGVRHAAHLERIECAGVITAIVTDEPFYWYFSKPEEVIFEEDRRRRIYFSYRHGRGIISPVPAS